MIWTTEGKWSNSRPFLVCSFWIYQFFPVLFCSSYFVPTKWHFRGSPTFLLSSLSMAKMQTFGKEFKKQLVEAVEKGTPIHLPPSFGTNFASPSFSLCCSVTTVICQNRWEETAPSLLFWSWESDWSFTSSEVQIRGSILRDRLIEKNQSKLINDMHITQNNLFSHLWDVKDRCLRAKARNATGQNTNLLQMWEEHIPYREV